MNLSVLCIPLGATLLPKWQRCATVVLFSLTLG